MGLATALLARGLGMLQAPLTHTLLAAYRLYRHLLAHLLCLLR